MKYIVYETTNLVNNKIYIGIHHTSDPYKFDGYLGCGVYTMWPYTYEHAKTAFQYAVKKYGPKNFKRKTLAIFDTEQEAADLEEELVNESFLERDDVYNMVLGGLGGYYCSNRIKVYEYDENGNYLNEYISFADAADKLACDYTTISCAVRKKVKAKNHFWSTDKVPKLDLTNYNLGKNPQIAIYCYLKNGKFLEEYPNQTQASKALNISISVIKEARLCGNCVNDTYYFCTVKDISYDRARKKYIQTRPVYKYDGNTGEFICGYNTQTEAELDNKYSNITKAIKLKTKDKNGFMWGIEKFSNYNKPAIKNKMRKVGKYSLSGELVTIYPSATAAARENGTSVWKVLAGMNKTHKEHVYRYIIEEVNDIV